MVDWQPLRVGRRNGADESLQLPRSPRGSRGVQVHDSPNV